MAKTDLDFLAGRFAASINDGIYRIHNFSNFSYQNNNHWLEVFLVKIPELLDAPMTAYPDDLGRKSVRIKVHAGRLPLLTYNAIFKNGERVDKSKIQFTDLKIETLTADLTNQVYAENSASIVNQKFRPIYQFAQMHLVKVNARQGENAYELFIPSIEVFRCFYGFNTKFIKALLNEPWDTSRHTLVHEAASGFFPNGIGQSKKPTMRVILRNKISGQDPKAAAILASIALESKGIQCAKSIFTSVRQDGKIKCIIPSDKQNFRLKGQVLNLDPCPITKTARKLLLTIHSSDFAIHTPEPRIEYDKEIGGVADESTQSTNECGPKFSGEVSNSPLEDYQTDDDANPHTDIVEETGGESLDFFEEPDVEKLSESASKTYLNYLKSKKGIDLHLSSSRNRSSGKTEAIQENVQQMDSHRSNKTSTEAPVFPRLPVSLLEILEAFNELSVGTELVEKIIQKYEIVECTDDLSISKGGRNLWMLPQWVNINKNNDGKKRRIYWSWSDEQNGVPRGILLVKLTLVGSGKTIFWVEIEKGKTLKGHESTFRSFLFKESTSDYKTVMTYLIKKWTQHSPTVSSGELLSYFKNLAIGITWKHTREESRLKSIHKVLKKIEALN